MDAYGTRFLSLALAEAKELLRVSFLVLQDPDALKTLSFDKITKKLQKLSRPCSLRKDDSKISVSHLGEDLILPKPEDRERITRNSHSNEHFPMRPTWR